MKNIHLIPTDNPSRLYLKYKELTLGTLTMSSQNQSILNQNIYITSSEEIKDGDWYLNNGHLLKCTELKIRSSCKKIILTTDPDLIKDGIQAINDEFLLLFVKNPICEKVEVERGYLGMGGFVKTNEPISKDKVEYKIIIPKEETPMKKELSSIEWLIEQIEVRNGIIESETSSLVKGTMISYGYSDLYEHAKGMHKKEIIEANLSARRQHAPHLTSEIIEKSRQYYNEKYFNFI